MTTTPLELTEEPSRPRPYGGRPADRVGLLHAAATRPEHLEHRHGSSIAALWLLPSFSMLVISFRQAGLFEQSGWWNVFIHISQFTL